MKVKNYVRSLCMFLLGLSVMTTAMAQEKTVSGKVVGADDASGLPGASVVVKGSTRGVTTDVNGDYSIKINGASDVLVVSFVGYIPQEVQVGNQTKINFSLASDNNTLEEVVVTGYSQLRKKDIISAVTVVDAKELEDVVASSVSQKLAGRAAGVTVATSGQPGEGTNIRIRGISSFNNNDPLLVVDGVQIQDKFLNSLNPNDIESMQVLKDAAAASIYGSRASNGVIIITTKKGKAGKAKLTYNGTVGTSSPVKGLDDILITDSQEFVDMTRTYFSAGGQAIPAYATGSLPTYIFPVANTVDESTYNQVSNPIMKTNQQGTNWWKEITQPGTITDHNLGLSGGNESATFRISAGYFKQNGTLIHTDFDRFSLRANSTYKVGKKFSFGQNVALSRSTKVSDQTAGGGNQSEQGVIVQAIKASPLVPVRDIGTGYGSGKSQSLSNGTNPVALLERNQNNRRDDTRILGDVYGQYEIISGLTFRSTLGFDFGTGKDRNFRYATPENNEPNFTNGFSEGWYNNFGFISTNLLSYNKTFGEKHNVSAFAGYEALKQTNRSIGGSFSSYFLEDQSLWYLNASLADPATRNVSSSGSENTLLSTFGQAAYSYDDKYFVTGSIRRDGSSRFGKENQYGIFPSVSAGWRVSSESFMQDLTWLSDMKLRFSYGESGNQFINNYNFVDNYGSNGVGNTFYDITGNNSSPAVGYTLVGRGNAATKWESSRTINGGLDLSLLNNSVGIVLDVYNRDTDGLLFNAALPGVAGAANAPFTNVAAMKNTGFDFAITYKKSVNKDLSLNTSLNISHYRNEIVTIKGDQEFFFRNGANRTSTPYSIQQLGSPISSFYGYQLDGKFASQAELDALDQPNAVVGGLRFKDLDGNGIINGDDLGIIGNPHPKFTAGLNLGADYKGFDLTAFFFGSYGNEIFNYNRIFTDFRLFNTNVSRERYLNAGQGEYTALNIADLSSRTPSEYYVEDGSYLRLAQLQLGYNLPSALTAKAGLENVRFFVQGQNLFTMTKYSGLDPALVTNPNVTDVQLGFDLGNYPSAKMYTFGVSLGF